MKLEKITSHNTVSHIGAWAFIIGLILALIVGIISEFSAFGLDNQFIVAALIICGAIVGFLNVTVGETKQYLLAAIALVLVASQGAMLFGELAVVGAYLKTTLTAMMLFIIPATIIVSLKTIYAIAQDS